MPDKKEEQPKEISVSSSGVTIKGDLVDAVGKPLKRVTGTADSVLRLVQNLVTLPFDYLSHNLEGFRAKFAEKFEEIPPESRIEPPMRVGCAILQQVGLSADEPDIQELFAQLLASASNAATAETVHPGFATVISELHAIDAKVLRLIARQASASAPIDYGRAIAGEVDTVLANRSISNLLRLGLLEWRDIPYSPDELHRFLGKQHYMAPTRSADLDRLFVDAVNDLQRLKNSIIKSLGEQHQRRALYLSTFGQHFIQAVLR